MAAASKDVAPVKDETDELFAGLKEDGSVSGVEDGDPFAGMDDLLDSVEEDDSEGWVPEVKGQGLVGTVVKVSETRSDFAKDGEDPMCPTWTIQGYALDAEGNRTGGKYRLIGYGTVLKREMKDAGENGPVIGRRVAVKYFGEKLVKNGKYANKPFKHYGLAVEPPKAG